MSVVSSAVLANSGIKFGTSGARGLVEQFTNEACAAFTCAFVAVMRQSFVFDRVAIGIDRRPSSPAMAAACAGALQQLGLEVDYYGILPTPALALKSMADGIPSIMITGSHIPFDRNGIKFYRPDGEIEKADELAILAVEAEVPAVEPCLPEASDAAVAFYRSRNLDMFPAGLLAGKRIGLYEHSAAGRDICRDVLEQLGATVVSLGRTETFVPIDTEAVSAEDQQRGREWAAEHQLDALFSTDGDGDRPLLGDETGTWLRGDILGLLCARYLGIQALAVPVSCNSAIEASGAFARVMRTRIGSPYVIEGMQQLAGEFAGVAGFEANGGFLLGTDIQVNGASVRALPTRDALLPALVLLAISVAENKPISAVLAELPARYTGSDRIQEFPTEKSQALIAGWREDVAGLLAFLGMSAEVVDVNNTDGLRLTLDNGEVVHLRPSGNAPELRCYAESASAEAASQLVTFVLGKLASLR
ncbi:phosphomannomutase [Parathalassolituus penaei]|uniref:Phosphomannomutase n=1 Tax=Parathalassolituus penaei TaxID=2997323 RepID=A0A9X3IV71_9GAMM|nr:phosphomannomutase [Parathalassolituus penaei]MCY0966953.1 phosphomannomutase [Parathalassolituus penaei]